MLGRKLRTVLTAIAIVLGVAMVSGTFVLTDSIDKAFSSIFTDARKGSDAVITGKAATSTNSGSTAPTLPASLLSKVRGLSNVAAAEGSVGGEAHLIGSNGKAIVNGGAPNLGFSIANGASRFNPLSLLSGHWPHGHEVVIDHKTAKDEHLRSATTIGVQAEGPVVRLKVSGIVKFGTGSLDIGGATLAGFDLPTAQGLFNKPGQFDEIDIAAKPSVSDRAAGRAGPFRPARERAGADGRPTGRRGRQGHQLVHLVPARLPARVRRHRALRRQLRDRELALDHHRAADAGVRDAPHPRRDPAPGAAVDLHRGAGDRDARVDHRPLPRASAREGPLRLFSAIGFTLPNTGILFATRTVIISLLVGIVVTLVASLRPAIRATRVPPIAAVREGATLPPSRFARFRTPGSLIVTALGFAAVIYGLFSVQLFGKHLGTTGVLVWMGLGALLVFIGVVAGLGAVRPAAGVVDRAADQVAADVPLARLPVPDAARVDLPGLLPPAAQGLADIHRPLVGL